MLKSHNRFDAPVMGYQRVFGSIRDDFGDYLRYVADWSVPWLTKQCFSYDQRGVYQIYLQARISLSIVGILWLGEVVKPCWRSSVTLPAIWRITAHFVVFPSNNHWSLADYLLITSRLLSSRNCFQHRQCFLWQQSAGHWQQDAGISAVYQHLIIDCSVI